jgi:hypothetical protein
MAKFLAVGTLALAIAGLPASAAQAQQPEAQPQASAQNAAQVPGPRPSTPPLPNRFNELTPKWLTMRGEFRNRMEGGKNIAYSPGLHDVYWLNRFRFDVSVKPSSRFAVLVQAQDARVAAKDVGSTTAPFRNPFDLRQAYGDIGNTQQGAFTLRVGRQEMFFGEQRLVGLCLSRCSGNRQYEHGDELGAMGLHNTGIPV